MTASSGRQIVNIAPESHFKVLVVIRKNFVHIGATTRNDTSFLEPLTQPDRKFSRTRSAPGTTDSVQQVKNFLILITAILSAVGCWDR